ncbi:hypothetical protein QEN19_000909 [Hanseniaspora menglaensis]
MSKLGSVSTGVAKKKLTVAKLKQSNLTAFLSLKEAAKNIVLSEDCSKLSVKEEMEANKIKFNNKFVGNDDLNKNVFLQLERDTVATDWFKLLSPIFMQPFFLELKKFIISEYESNTVFPPMNEIYSFTQLTNLSNIKCIIIGQDPYHNEGQAHGLAFSIKNTNLKSLPPSLKNIYKAIKLNYPEIQNLDDKYGNLKKWSNQGVLLTNRLLTVIKNKPLSHKNHGWETFQDKLLIKLVNFKIIKNQKIVFMLWGDQAKNTIYKNKALMALIEKNRTMVKIIENVHPSPLSCNRKMINPVTKEKDYRPWFDKRDFIECNEWLAENDLEHINWGNV